MKFNIILQVTENDEKDALHQITSEYPKNNVNKQGSKNGGKHYLISVTTSDSSDMIKNSLNKIKGVNVISVGSEMGILSRIPRKFSTWMLIGLISCWLVITHISFNIPNNFIDTLSQSQLLVIQISIALGISVWIFLYDRKTQTEIIDVLAKLDLRTSEINENVKDLT